MGCFRAKNLNALDVPNDTLNRRLFQYFKIQRGFSSTWSVSGNPGTLSDGCSAEIEVISSYWIFTLQPSAHPMGEYGVAL